MYNTRKGMRLYRCTWLVANRRWLRRRAIRPRRRSEGSSSPQVQLTRSSAAPRRCVRSSTLFFRDRFLHSLDESVELAVLIHLRSSRSPVNDTGGEICGPPVAAPRISWQRPRTSGGANAVVATLPQNSAGVNRKSPARPRISGRRVSPRNSRVVRPSVFTSVFRGRCEIYP
jgi:hypothetical protein